MDATRTAALALFARAWERIRARCPGDDPDRGDVPGWVLVTLMSVGIVSALWLVAQPQLTHMLDGALGSVTGP